MPIVRGRRRGYIGVAYDPTGGFAAMAVEIEANYKPCEDEPFMNDRQREYFQAQAARMEGRNSRGEPGDLGEPAERQRKSSRHRRRASSETDRSIELRSRDRQRKLISKIDAALARIDEGVYGFCEETGEPISLKRLDARPIATLSIEAQERHERREKVYRDD